MSTIRLDIPTAHSDDISEPMEGQFGNVYHTWDKRAARQRRIDDTQIIVAANKLSDQENKEAQ
jgi:hypothetical protein